MNFTLKLLTRGILASPAGLLIFCLGGNVALGAEIIALKEWKTLAWNPVIASWRAESPGTLKVEEKPTGTGVHFENGAHNMAKIYWPVELNEGDRFLMEVKGAFSVEAVSMAPGDINTHFILSPSDQFLIVEIRRLKDRCEFLVNGEYKKPTVMAKTMQGPSDPKELMSGPLFPALSVRIHTAVEFRNAEIIRP